MGIKLRKRMTRSAGAGFAVKQPKYSDDLPERAEMVRVTVVMDGEGVFNIALDDRLILSLNRDTARELGIALIVETDL